MPLGASRFGLLGGVVDPGKLELIETQSYSTSVSQIDFTSIQESTYNVHLLTFANVGPSAGPNALRARLFESGTLETGSVYQYAAQYGFANATFGENRSTTHSYMQLAWNATSAGTPNPIGGYAYFYNLGDSSKYSFNTGHWTQIENNGVYVMGFGSNVLPQASTVDGIRLDFSSGANFVNFDISLYGIAES